MHKDCVIGYVKNMQKLMPMTSAYYNIPALVTFMILDYYYLREIFSDHGHKTKIDRTGLIASINDQDEDNTVYGTVIIDFNESYIYKWSIKVIELTYTGDRSDMAIGIVAIDKINGGNGDFTYQSDDDFVAYHSMSIYSGSKKYFEIGYNEFADNDAEQYDKGDVITMEINTKDVTIEFWKNKISFGQLLESGYKLVDRKKKYKLAVLINNKSAVEIVDFDQRVAE